jgi:glycosyltransferase 2 family protein
VNDLLTLKRSLPYGLRILLVGSILYFIVTGIPLKPAQIADYLLHAGAYFYASLLLFSFFLVLQAAIWVIILNDSGQHIGLMKGLTIYINTQFAKYIPGGFWNYAGRVVLTSREGVGLSIQMTTIFYENILIAAYLFYTKVTIMLQISVRWILHKLPWKKFSGPGSLLARNHFYQYLLYFLISHFVMGLAFWLLIRSFHLYNIGIFYAAGTFASAWLLGLLSPLPGGIGIREGFLVYFLSFQMDAETALQISVVARIWNVMSEVLFFLGMNAIQYIIQRMRLS